MADASNRNHSSDPGGEREGARPPIALSSGTVLRDEYRVEEVLGVGSFGITYRARDRHLQADVAIKEYYPRHIAGRESGTATIRPHSADATEEYEYGLEQFIEEARTIAQFDHPNIVDVRSYFEENGTGYLVMDYYEGQSLSGYLAEQGGWIPEEEAVALMQDILAGLQRVHDGGILHRDIDPQNIYRTTKGEAILIDFGAAREAVGSRSQRLSVILKPGYAPIEQYSASDDQGPSTDIYACAATLYKCLTGLKPLAATDRVQTDKLEAPHEVRPEVSLERSLAVMKGLSLRAEKRPGSAEAFASLLAGMKTEQEDTLVGDDVDTRTTGTIPSGPDGTEGGREERWRPSWQPLAAIGGVIAALLIGAGVLFYPQMFSGSEPISGETTKRAVAVLPFEVSGAGTQAWKDGMVTMLSMNLDGAGGLRAIADRRIFAAAEQVDSSSLGERSPALAVAKQAGAQYAVIGSAVQLGGTLRLGADVHDVESGTRLGQIEVQGTPDSVTVLTDRLTRKVLGVLLEKSEEQLPSVNMASITTESLDALNLFLQGEQHYRASEYEAAVDDYEAAVRTDSTFALAYARLQSVRFWSGQDEGDAIQKAYALSDRLPERERRLVRGIYLWQQGRGHEAATRLRHLSADYPDAPSVWYWLGEVLFHSAVPPGLLEAEAIFERAIQLDPGLPSYHHHFVELAFVLHHDSSLAARRIDAHPDGPRKEMYRVAWDLVFGAEARQANALARVDSIPPYTARQLFNTIRHPTDGDLRAAVLPRLIRRDLPPFPYAGILVASSLGQGQVDTAQAQMRRWPLEPFSSTCLPAFALSLGVSLPDSVLQARLNPSRLERSAAPELIMCAGIYLVEQGRSEALPALFERLRTAGTEQGWSAAAMQRLVDEVRGYRAFRAGSWARADTLWAGQLETDRWGAIWRGDLHRERGRLREAEDWYQAAWRHPVAHERLGQLYEQMNEPENAREAYQRFIKAWKNADPELQPRVKTVRQQLTELGDPPATE